MATLPDLLKTTVEVGGSDLHLTTDSPPQVRVHGELRRLQMPNLSPADTKSLVYSVLTDSQKKDLVEFLKALSGEGWQHIKAPTRFPE